MALTPAARPGPNITDLIDTREDRRDKRFRKRKLAAEMRATDPIENRKRARAWAMIRMWLTMPEYRDGLEDPHKGAKGAKGANPGDTRLKEL